MFDVIVSNYGTVYHGTDLEKARKTFAWCVARSRPVTGKYAGESVTLSDDDEILDRVEPELDFA